MYHVWASPKLRRPENSFGSSRTSQHDTGRSSVALPIVGSKCINWIDQVEGYPPSNERCLKKKREKWRVLGQHQLFSRLIFRAPNCQGTTSHTCPIWKVFGCQTMLPSTRAWERWRAKLCPGVWRLTNVSVWDNWVELLTSVMMLQQNCLRINVEPCKPLLKWHDVQECHFQDLFMDGINAAET